MERRDFVRESAKALEHIERVLGDLEHENLDPQLGGDVLTLAFEDGAKFVINAHSAALQVWMAAGTSAWHFDFDSERGAWIAAKNGDELMSTVGRVVSEKLQTTVSL